MDEFLDEMDDEQVDDLLQPEEGEDKAPQLYEHFRFVADRGQSLLRVDKFLVDRMFGATRNRIQSAADAGCIMANGSVFQPGPAGTTSTWQIVASCLSPRPGISAIPT